MEFCFLRLLVGKEILGYASSSLYKYIYKPLLFSSYNRAIALRAISCQPNYHLEKQLPIH
jgi:hypothetical protein